MKTHIAIMQPYVFPYIGYFQLISAVDVFIFYNDVNFIKKGWINRNRILVNEKDFLFTIPCSGISQNKTICNTKLAFDHLEKRKLLETIVQAYKKAPFFDSVYPLVEAIILEEHHFIDQLAISSVKQISNFLKLKVICKESRNCYDNEALRKADRLIDICQKEKISNYINALGGTKIYNKEYFYDRCIELNFLKPHPVVYKQFNNDFVPWLSIIDVLMFNNIDQVTDYLNSYELL